ncbi:hypothetical protein SAMN05192541_1833 [Bradyrhizobium arachidis]|uniref:Uncharacterized protein n=1 Tax=Bradyrhizobium arachidis TaxID=858423 RepID=A0AAE7NSV1_9BRAD|nr:hypothetical protein [Bradyrhizobium arachidis]QOZ71082.1 hypothetical protein WN72_35815 [Bradyrhizobium arachidis]SFV19961.1 hypothetical protein SAMN05192541_1833 [Bradyrhizobium arachidis]
MRDLRDLLIRGSEKVIGHYRILLASAKTEAERQLYRSRIDREQRLLDELHSGFPDQSRTGCVTGSLKVLSDVSRRTDLVKPPPAGQYLLDRGCKGRLDEAGKGALMLIVGLERSDATHELHATSDSNGHR